MPLEEKMNYLNNCSYQSRLNFLLASNCAPVIKNLTCANTLTVKSGSFKHIAKSLENTNLEVICLYANQDNEVLMVYRKDDLFNHLIDKETNLYLKEFGYETDDINMIFAKLSYRFKQFYLEKEEFPHELGIFLNYPIEDIKGFIKNNGRNSLFTKYWKVYSNLSLAKETFKRFDEAFEEALRQIVDGYKICDIVA